MFLAGKRLVALHLDQPSRCDPINVREREFLTMRKRRLALSGKLLNTVSEKTLFQAKEQRRILRVIHVGD